MGRTLGCLIAAALTAGLVAGPVSADCGTNALITSISRDGESFIFNPAFAGHPSFAYSPHGRPYVFSTDPGNPAPAPLSRAATITFWSLGAGDSTVGVGSDNGSYDLIAGNGFEFYSYTGPEIAGGLRFGGRLLGTWEGGTDNCVGPNACMCVLFTDRDARGGLLRDSRRRGERQRRYVHESRGHR